MAKIKIFLVFNPYGAICASINLNMSATHLISCERSRIMVGQEEVFNECIIIMHGKWYCLQNILIRQFFIQWCKHSLFKIK